MSSNQPMPLLPCPFCGVVPECNRIFEDDPEAYIVDCRNEVCVRRETIADTRQKAIAAWNTRADVAPPSYVVNCQRCGAVVELFPRDAPPDVECKQCKSPRSFLCVPHTVELFGAPYAGVEVSTAANLLAEMAAEYETSRDPLDYAAVGALRAAESRLRALKGETWRSVIDELPTHVYSVLIRITGGKLHCGEDFTDIGIYNDREKRWQTNDGDDDCVVEVSHWMPIPPPPKEQS